MVLLKSTQKLNWNDFGFCSDNLKIYNLCFDFGCFLDVLCFLEEWIFLRTTPKWKKKQIQCKIKHKNASFCRCLIVLFKVTKRIKRLWHPLNWIYLDSLKRLPIHLASNICGSQSFSVERFLGSLRGFALEKAVFSEEFANRIPARYENKTSRAVFGGK